ncbi:hypothetical protein GCM10011581_44300 [Saccharopolyspora subtropica]|uniref:Uncharacterized protein n=1 Tax=Saccharopolyspora thermophila TaxID=89367 RepID=A0A917K6X7_9PSEU|nr:hypothetical protein GCM10011581_44300 [Saccharopolyspora subtropica]
MRDSGRQSRDLGADGGNVVRHENLLVGLPVPVPILRVHTGQRDVGAERIWWPLGTRRRWSFS